jgi:hypothetical protein
VQAQSSLTEAGADTAQLESSAPAESSKAGDGDHEMGEEGGEEDAAAVDARSIYIGNVSCGLVLCLGLGV